MKNKRNIMNYLGLVVAAGLMVVFAACADDNEKARTPQVQVAVSKTALEINESMELRFSGVADQIVVYTGDKEHQYELRDSSNTGFAVNKGLFSYSYSTPGTFHVVCIASTYDTYLGGSLQTDTYSFDVTVTDDVTEIEAIYSTVTPNVYYAQLVGSDVWVMRLPKKQVYNNREMNVNASRQRLNFTIASDSAKIYVDGEQFNSRNYYDLAAEHAVRVVSGSGTERNYRYYGLVYPEFETLTVGGLAPTFSRSAFYQDMIVCTVAVGSDLTLDYTLEPDVTLYADGTAIAPGAWLDFAKTYTLRRTHAENRQVVAETRVTFQTE